MVNQVGALLLLYAFQLMQDPVFPDVYFCITHNLTLTYLSTVDVIVEDYNPIALLCIYLLFVLISGRFGSVFGHRIQW